MFGMGFSEIMIIVVIAVLFLGPDKLPNTMIDIAKFFRNTKKTINSLKDSFEQEINVSELKQEALTYKKELLEASEEVKKTTDMSDVSKSLSEIQSDITNYRVIDDTNNKKEENTNV